MVYYRVINSLTNQILFKCSSNEFKFADKTPKNALKQWFSLEEISKLHLTGCHLESQEFHLYEIEKA